MIGGGGEEATAPAVEGSQPLDWKFAQVFSERTAGEELQEGSWVQFLFEEVLRRRM